MATMLPGTNRFPRILFFIAGSHPTAAEAAAYKLLRDEHGASVLLRNAALVSNVPTSSLEDCDAVAGAVIPSRYASTYPAVDDLTAAIVNRVSDFDLPHAEVTGAVTDAGNEAARAARAPSLLERRSAHTTAPAATGVMRQRHGGVVIPAPQGQTLAGFGGERAENRRETGNEGIGATEGGLAANDGVDRSSEAVTTGKTPEDATPPPAGTDLSGFGVPPQS